MEKDFRDLWINNAIAIAQQSCGTPAMKLDFYQEGKRSFAGQMQDLGVGIRRLYLGLFKDYHYQNCLDLHFKKLKQREENLELSS